MTHIYDSRGKSTSIFDIYNVRRHNYESLKISKFMTHKNESLRPLEGDSIYHFDLTNII